MMCTVTPLLVQAFDSPAGAEHCAGEGAGNLAENNQYEADSS